MAFSIIFNGQAFGLEEFVQVSFDAPYIVRAQAFLHTWQNGEIFTFYSSGTTGVPKQIFFSKAQLILSAQSTIDAMQLGAEEEHILACLDVQFVGGAMMLARALVLNCQVTLFEPSRDILSLLSPNHLYTFASFVPLQLQNLAENISVFKRIHKVLLGGTSLPPMLLEQLEVMPNKVYHTFGMTETLSHVALRHIGVDTGYRVIAPHKIRLNELHQICISTPLYANEIITNDVAKWIDENHFEWLGRTDFVINTGGVKVHPEVVENLIINSFILPIDLTFCIAKAPHPSLQEQVVLVSTHKDAEQYFKRIGDYFKEKGQSFAKPQRFIYVDAIPKNENGKILRHQLNEMIENEML